MKIFYFIFSRGKASGGHYHSCDQISRSLSKNFKIDIISIGENPSPVLIKNPNFKTHVSYRSFKDTFNLNKTLFKLIKEIQPDLIHCYDTESMNRILPLPALWNKKVVLTKCGGPSPIRKTWQFANSIINFSYENHSWFKNNKEYNKVNLYHIANRVDKLSVLNNSKHVENKDNDTFNFVRIARIGGAYEKTLLDTYNLIEKLKNKNKVKLYIIGRIKNEERYRYLKHEAERRELPVQFITDNRASKASDFLYLADCVIGTGRSFMEAASQGIPILTPAKNNNLPVLVTKSNFLNFFKTNFSERNFADEASVKNNLDYIFNLIKDNNYYNEISQDSKYLFDEYFSTEKIFKKYKDVYINTLNRNNFNRTSLLLKNKLYILKVIFNI